MATFLGASTLLVFGRFEVRTPAKFTALALLKLLFSQFRVRSSRKSLGTWNLGPSVLARIAYFHVPNESVSDAVDVLHPPLQERTAVLVEQALVNLNQDTPVWLGTEGLGFDKRVDEAPLARPIRSHALVSIEVPTLHSVGPLHVLVHHRKYRVNVPRVESSVGSAEKFPNVGGCRLVVHVRLDLVG